MTKYSNLKKKICCSEENIKFFKRNYTTFDMRKEHICQKMLAKSSNGAH
jgi:hypothetical protein